MKTLTKLLATVALIFVCTTTADAQLFRRGGGGCSSCSGDSCSSGGCASGNCSMTMMGGGCANGQCSLQQPQSSSCPCTSGNCPADCAMNGCTCSMASAGSRWVPVPNHEGQYAHYISGTHTGSWDESQQIFRTYNATTQTWGPAVYERPADLPAAGFVIEKKPAAGKPATTTTTPAPPTGKATAETTQEKTTAGDLVNTVKDWQVNGFTWAPPDENMMWEGGVRTPESKVMGGAGGDIPDYSKRKRIVVVSSDAARRKGIAKQIADSPLGTTRDVQDFAPSAWQVKPMKLAEDAEFARTDLVMLEMGPVEKDGTAVALHAEHTFGDIVQFGRKIDPNFTIGGVPSSERAGISGELPIALLIVVGIVFGAVLLLPAKKTAVAVEPTEGEMSWAQI